MKNNLEKSFYITTPIYYVNDIPHIGHAYSTIAADIMARYKKLKGKSVFFLTGTDEHGQKVEQSAKEKFRSPIEHTDIMVKNFKNLWERLNISYNGFIRTTDIEHKKIVQDLLQILWDKKEIYKHSYKGMYCTPCERFWTDKDLINGNCPDCKRMVEAIEEENYFFLMSRYQERLINHIENNPYYILPETRKNEVLGFLKSKPLGDLCISRPQKRLSWGIPLPFDAHYVTYVWFDALVNYYSAMKYLIPKDLDINHCYPANHHIIGKDILIAHSIYWSTMQMALEIPLPNNIFAHGWWLVNGKKMSKSLGNVIDPFEISDKYGSEAIRFFLFREVPFGMDGDFLEDALIKRINTDLANDLGNLASRIFAMINKYFDGRIPEPDEVEEEIKNIAEDIKDKIEDSLNFLDFYKTLEFIWELVSYTNKYIDLNAPWKLAKSKDTFGRLKTVIYSVSESLRFLALYLYPFLPETSPKIIRQLGIKESIDKVNLDKECHWGKLESNVKIKMESLLFPRIEKSKTKINIIRH